MQDSIPQGYEFKTPGWDDEPFSVEPSSKASKPSKKASSKANDPVKKASKKASEKKSEDLGDDMEVVTEGYDEDIIVADLEKKAVALAQQLNEIEQKTNNVMAELSNAAQAKAELAKSADEQVQEQALPEHTRFKAELIKFMIKNTTGTEYAKACKDLRDLYLSL